MPRPNARIGLAGPAAGASEGAASESAASAAATTTAASRSVLIVSYHFPPDGRVGAVRPAKFAKYLARLGWKPHVLTVNTRYLPVQEQERLEDVATTPISRTRVWPTLPDVLVRLRNLARSAFWKLTDPRDIGGSDRAGPRNEFRDADPSHVRRLLRLLFEFPDVEVGWVIPAVWQGYRIIRRERIGVVLVTCPPRSSVLIGLLLSRLTGCRLITDLRDPLHSTGVDGQARTRTGLVMDWIERRVMERSHQIITTADNYTEWLRTRFASLPAGKFHTITNGFDPEDFEETGAAVRNGRFTMTYLGTFYWTRTPRPLLAAISQLLEEGTMPRESLQVNFIGTVTHATGEDVAQIVRAYGLEDIVTLRGVVPYRRSLAEMKGADVLLLLAPEEQSYGIPAKTFEYLAAGRPILCLGDKGAAPCLIRDTGAGPVVPPSDVGAIKQAVSQLFEDWRSGSYRSAPRAFDPKQFERAALTARLAAVLASQS